jgi:protein-S-isoprenylcysteine O-methyltransferase Ste14
MSAPPELWRAIATAGLTLSTIYVLTPPNAFIVPKKAAPTAETSDARKYHDDSSHSPGLAITQNLHRMIGSPTLTGVALYTSTGLAIWPLIQLIFPPSTPSTNLDLAVDIASATLATLGCVLRFAAFRGLGKGFTFTIQTWEDQKLVTDGIYSWVRHPAYAGWYLIFFGYPLFFRQSVEKGTTWALTKGVEVLGKVLSKWIEVPEGIQVEKYGKYVAWGLLAVYTAVWWDANNKRMAVEEKVLEDKFPEYKDYEKKVKRVIPYVW